MVVFLFHWVDYIGIFKKELKMFESMWFKTN